MHKVLIRRGNRGFTLMELLVVIALVALLVTVMVPVMLNFLRGRGLGMAGNNIAGFFAYARGEAMNRRMPHAVVYYFEEDTLPTGGIFEDRVGPGMVLFRINPRPRLGEPEITYVRQLSFAGGIGGTIDFAGSWKARAQTTPVSRNETDASKSAFRGKYRVWLETDGRMQIPDDQPGYVLDTDQTRNIRTDLVITDGERFVFMDLNGATGGIKRSGIINAEDTTETP